MKKKSMKTGILLVKMDTGKPGNFNSLRVVIILWHCYLEIEWDSVQKKYYGY